MNLSLSHSLARQSLRGETIYFNLAYNSTIHLCRKHFMKFKIFVLVLDRFLLTSFCIWCLLVSKNLGCVISQTFLYSACHGYDKRNTHKEKIISVSVEILHFATNKKNPKDYCH